MFTGIIGGLGTVESAGPTRLSIGDAALVAECRIGDSVAVNGCCLTVVSIDGDRFAADLSDETLSRTTLGSLRPGDRVNLELALALGERLGGHLVQGHVDGVGIVAEPAPELRIRIEAGLSRFMVEKGSVTIDGVSLTVVHTAPGEFGVSVIPHTASVTTLGMRRRGDRVNVEADVLAKYVEGLLGPYGAARGAAPLSGGGR